MTYRRSKQRRLGDQNKNSNPQGMFFVPRAVAENWAAKFLALPNHGVGRPGSRFIVSVIPKEPSSARTAESAN